MGLEIDDTSGSFKSSSSSNHLKRMRSEGSSDTVRLPGGPMCLGAMPHPYPLHSPSMPSAVGPGTCLSLLWHLPSDFRVAICVTWVACRMPS